jgi:hypothetical protein
MEISMLPAFVASEDDARHLSSGGFVQRRGRDRDLLASNAQFPPQGSGPPHFDPPYYCYCSLSMAGIDPRLAFGSVASRTVGAPVPTMFQIPNFYDMGNPQDSQPWW